MLSAGEGRELWHVRVDLIAPDDDGGRVLQATEGLRPLLDGEKTGPGHDCGADDVGGAATTALATAREAGRMAQAGPDYYDVSLVPRSAVLVPESEHTIDLLD